MLPKVLGQSLDLKTHAAASPERTTEAGGKGDKLHVKL